MKEIINSIINKNVKHLELYLNLVSSNNNLYHIFFFIIHQLINNKLSDIDACPMFYLLIKHNLIITNIKNIYTLLFLLKKNNFIKSYQLLLSCLKKQIIINNIIEYILLFKKSFGSIHKLFKFIDVSEHKKCVDDFNKIINNELTNIIVSFNDKKFINIIKNINSIKHFEKFNKQQWNQTHELEIINRLNDMVSLFGTKLLRKFGINIISISDYNCLKYKNKIKYYSNCCSSLTNFLNKIHKLFKNYKQVSDEIHYINSTFFNDIIDDSDELDDTYDSAFIDSSDENNIDCIDIPLYDITQSEENKINTLITNVVNNFFF